jgi:hypothetical protein
MEDQITMVFLDVMDEAMSIVQEEAAASSSTRRPKHHQRCINRDRGAAHFRM